MTERYYNEEQSALINMDTEYEAIRTPGDLYDALSGIWCEYTCAPRMRKNWKRENMTLGQCSVTSFLAQDVFGGKVYGIPLEDGSVHCFNVVDGIPFDLTSAQFPDEELDYEHVTEQFREEHFRKQEKYERYQYLCDKLHECMKKG